MAVREDFFKPVLRRAERDAYCRACSGDIKKGETMISWYSSANRGMHIHIHTECGQRIGDLAHDGQISKNRSSN